MKKIVVLLLVVIMSAFVFAGCGSNGTTEDTKGSQDAQTSAATQTSADTKSADKVYRVGFVNIASSNEVCAKAERKFVEVVQSDEFKKKIGSDKNVVVVVADSNSDIGKQTTNVETLLAQGVDAMFIIGVDTAGNATAVKACNDAKVPVFMVATASNGGDWKFVGFNETDFGVRQAKYVAEKLKKNGNVCYLSGTPGREATIAREKGTLDTLKQMRPDINIIGNQTGDFTAETAMKVTEDWIQAQGDKIDCIITADATMAQGAIQALKAANMTNKVMVAGCITNGTWDVGLMKDGFMEYAIYVDFGVLGNTCATVCEQFYTGKDIPKETFMEMFDVTKDNLTQYFK